jgi:hypothetical protein
MPDTALDYGPQTAHILALIARAWKLTPEEISGLTEALIADGDPVMIVTGDAAGDLWDAMDADRAAWTAAKAAGIQVRTDWATWDAAHAAGTTARVVRATGGSRAAAQAAVRAALALATRDELDPKHYRDLTGPWALVVGKVHPDD